MSETKTLFEHFVRRYILTTNSIQIPLSAIYDDLSKVTAKPALTKLLNKMNETEDISYYHKSDNSVDIIISYKYLSYLYTPPILDAHPIQNLIPEYANLINILNTLLDQLYNISKASVYTKKYMDSANLIYALGELKSTRKQLNQLRNYVRI